MRAIAVLVANLACTGHRCKVKMTGEQGLIGEHHKSPNANNMSTSSHSMAELKQSRSSVTTEFAPSVGVRGHITAMMPHRQAHRFGLVLSKARRPFAARSSAFQMLQDDNNDSTAQMSSGVKWRTPGSSTPYDRSQKAAYDDLGASSKELNSPSRQGGTAWEQVVQPDEMLSCKGECEISGYRSGNCHQCNSCPSCWSAVELYSEHYRCAELNGLKTQKRAVDLGTVSVGDTVRLGAQEQPGGGFMQSPTLPRLPPGLRFFDDGALSGAITYDPLRAEAYSVEFAAVSTRQWDDPSVGLVRLEITFTVTGNVPQEAGDYDRLERIRLEHTSAGAAALKSTQDAFGVYALWEKKALTIQETTEQMITHLHALRDILKQHPRLGDGIWWAVLGGLHMNVHKLMENTLFECELYLGQALMFANEDVRHQAEMNLDGCYKKRVLEAAKFMWMDGLQQMMHGKWSSAGDTLQRAAAKRDGWGWGVNLGEIWIAAAAARIIEVARLQRTSNVGVLDEIKEVSVLLQKARSRCSDHPWMQLNTNAAAEYLTLLKDGSDTTEWERKFEESTKEWCATYLTNWQPKPRLEEASTLVQQLPGHISE